MRPVTSVLDGVRTTARPTPTSTRGPLAGWVTSGLVWSAVVSTLIVCWVTFKLGGREYYWTPLPERPSSAWHPLLRPSGPGGQTMGLIGTLLMLMPFVYMMRKRVSWLKGSGSLRGWLEVHLFCGIVGPVLITLHTSFKFNGIVSAAYWSMVVVVLSGFVGRYLFVRIPRSIRGNELTRIDLDARAESLRVEIAASVPSMALLGRVQAFERAVVPERADLSLFDLFTGELGVKRRLRRFECELDRAGVAPNLVAEVVSLSIERATLLRRMAYLQKTKTLFGAWHVFHLPLVCLLTVIVVVHVGITVYLGYVPFRW